MKALSSGKRELPLKSIDVFASEGVLRDEEEWYRGNIVNVFVSLINKERRRFFVDTSQAPKNERKYQNEKDQHF